MGKSIKSLTKNLRHNNSRQGQSKKEHTQDNGDPEQSFFDSTASCKHPPTIHSGQPTQTSALILKYDTNNQSD